MHAAELAADEAAAGGLDRGVHLAAALVKVARLATTIPSDPLPASALYRGEPITERVHRLLAPPPVSEVRRWPTWACTCPPRCWPGPWRWCPSCTQPGAAPRARPLTSQFTRSITRFSDRSGDLLRSSG